MLNIEDFRLTEEQLKTIRWAPSDEYDEPKEEEEKDAELEALFEEAMSKDD